MAHTYRKPTLRRMAPGQRRIAEAVNDLERTAAALRRIVDAWEMLDGGLTPDELEQLRRIAHGGEARDRSAVVDIEAAAAAVPWPRD